MLPHPPRPRGLPWLGNLPAFALDRLGAAERWAAEHGDVVELTGPFAPVVLVNHPELVGQVLTADPRTMRKDPWTTQLSELLGRGLVTSEGAFWKSQRRAVNPGFHRERIRGYAAVMTDCAREVVAAWPDRGELDLHRQMMDLTFRIVARALFADDGARHGALVAEVLDEYSRFAEGLAGSGVRYPPWVPARRNRRMARQRARLDRVVHEMITARRRQPGDDLLSWMVATGMPDTALRDEAVTLLLAGHETTANALTFALYALSQHPGAEEALLTELRAAPRALGADDLDGLPVLDRTVTEAMRLYPPVWGLGRQTLDDLSLGGFRVARGSTLFLLPWTLHRDARWYDEPLAFRPERWVDAEVPRYAYLPFGAGQRACIGQRFAGMEARLALAEVVRSHAVRLAPGERLELHASVTLRPKGGLRAVVERRGARQP
jgi:cytochrome P450